MLYTPSTGTTTLNTDLKAYVSRDNGTTYTQATLVGKGSYSGTTQIASVHNLDIQWTTRRSSYALEDRNIEPECWC